MEVLGGSDSEMGVEEFTATPIDAELTPKVIFTASSPYIGVERIARLNHGVDPDSREKHPLITLCVHPVDLNLLATGGHEGSVCLWRLKVEEVCLAVDPVTTLVGHSGQVNAVRFSPGSGLYLASGSADSTIRVYSSSSKWSLAHSLRGHRLDVSDLAWFSATLLVSCSADGRAIVWDAVSGGKVQEMTLGSCSPKGILVDPEYVAILFDAGLIDVYRHTKSGFRLTRQINLPKEDSRNFGKSTRTTLYPRRAAWTPDKKHVLFPLATRGSNAAAVMYERSTLLEPSPNELFVSERVFLGHPSRVVLATVGGSRDQSVSVLVSADGVLSVWGSNSELPLAVVANLLGPFGICTDAAWQGGTLLLSSSDGAVTAIVFHNIFTKEDLPAPAEEIPSAQFSSMQMETRTLGGKRKIQPIILNSVSNDVISPSIFEGSHLVCRNNTVWLNDVQLTRIPGTSITALTHNASYIVVGSRSSDSWVSIFDKTTISLVLEPICLGDSVIYLSVSKSNVLCILTPTCVSVWQLGNSVTVIIDAPLTGLFQSDPPVSVRLTDSGEVLTELASGTLVRFNTRINRWTMHKEDYVVV